MPTVEPKWGSAQEVQQGLEAGRLYRDGGVVREAQTGRVVRVSRQADVERDTLAECVRPLVPLVLHEALEARVLRIEAPLRTMAREIIHLSQQVRPADAARNGVLMGQVVSTLQLMKMHLVAGEAERATALWTELYRGVLQLFMVAEELLAQSDMMQRHLALWLGYSRVCWGAGVLTVDLLIQQGYAGYADMVAAQLVERAEAFRRHLQELLSRFSSWTWLSLDHREALQELREVKRRLSARQDALAQGFFDELRALGEKAPEAAALPGAPEAGGQQSLAG